MVLQLALEASQLNPAAAKLEQWGVGEQDFDGAIWTQVKVAEALIGIMATPAIKQPFSQIYEVRGVLLVVAAQTLKGIDDGSRAS